MSSLRHIRQRINRALLRIEAFRCRDPLPGLSDAELFVELWRRIPVLERGTEAERSLAAALRRACAPDHGHTDPAWPGLFTQWTEAAFTGE